MPRIELFQLQRPAETRRANGKPFRKLGRPFGQDQHVPRVLPLRIADDGKVLWQFHGHVLEAVDGQVHPLFPQGKFQFLHK